MKEKKLLIFIVPNGELIGGAQKRYLNIIKYLLKNKQEYIIVLNNKFYDNIIQADILSPNERLISINIDKQFSSDKFEKVSGKYVKKSEHTNKIIFLLGKIKSFIKLTYKWFRFCQKMLPVLKNYNIEIVYAIWYGGIWIWPLKLIKRFTLVYSFNDSGYSSIRRGLLNIFSSEYYVIKKADKIDFLSYDLIKGFKERNIFFKPSKVNVTPNSFIDYSFCLPMEKKEKLIVFLARLSQIKNPMMVAEAAELINNEIIEKKYRILVIGNGSQFSEIASLIREKNIKNIELSGDMINPIPVLNKSMIFLSIQQNNNYPSQSLIEAMACENAIIASDVGETRKLVTDKEGVLINPDKESLANAIIDLINNPEKSKMMGKNARRKVLADHTIEKYMDYFERITC